MLWRICMKISAALAVILGIFILGVLLMSEGITGMVSSESSMPAKDSLAVPAMDIIRFYFGAILLCSIVILLGLSSLKILKLKL